MQSGYRLKKRKPHHKVRTGCDNCKRRRIKCDELKPACRRCALAGISCSGYNAPSAWVFEPSTSKSKTSNTSHDDTHLTLTRRQTALPLKPALNFAIAHREYARRAYGPRDEARISNLFQFLLSTYGPNFVWRVHTDQQEQRTFAPKFVQYCLREPALLEALFSAACLQMYLDAPNHTDDAKEHPLQHHCRSLVLLKDRLSSPSAAFDDAIFWTIIAILVFNQEMGDWKSFALHLAGLRRIVSMRGGVNALHAVTPRASTFFLWAEATHANHRNLSRGNPSLKGNHDDDDDDDIDANQDEGTELALRHATQLPHGIQKMVIKGLLRPPIIILAHEVTQWVDTHVTSTSTSTSTSSTPPTPPLSTPPPKTRRTELATRLDQILPTGTLNPNEHLLCIGLFALVICLPPHALAETFPTTINAHMATLEATTADLADADVDAPCLLWSALMLASVQVYFGIAPKHRWHLLERFVRAAGRGTRWHDVAPLTEGFPRAALVQTQWPDCWAIAVSRVFSKSSAFG